MPKRTLIQGIWWSAYYKTDWNGYITNINKVYFKDASNNTVSFTSGSFLNRVEEGGKLNMTFIFFPVPILTHQLRLGDLTYTVNPRGDNPLPNYDDGHYILYEMELFGCDNYVIDESKPFSQVLFIKG